MKIASSVADLVGKTPLVRLNRVTGDCGATILGKLEAANPGNSVKDRIGHAMIEAAEADGTLKPGGTVVEATGGNTGLALAMAASLKGYKCICTMPDKMSSGLSGPNPMCKRCAPMRAAVSRASR